MNELSEFLPKSIEVMLSLEVFHFQSLITLRVQAVHHQLLQYIALLMKLLKYWLQYFQG